MPTPPNPVEFRIRTATRADAATILELIRALADFEKLAKDVVATVERIEATLFSSRPAAEVIIGEIREAGTWKNAAFALYFTTYSTFLAKPGLYLEDLFVRPEFRSHGLGRKMLAELARIAVSRDCGRLEWSVLDWNKRAWEFYARLGAKPMTEWTMHRVSGTELEALAREGTTSSSATP